MATLQFNVRTAQAQAALSALEMRMTRTSAVIGTGARMADAALLGMAGSFMALGAGAFVAYNAVAQFQESLTTVRALGGVTESQMYELADSINEVSAQFGVSGEEIAEGAVMLSKAGLSVEEINQSIGAMTALSKANGLAFEEAARMVVFAVNTFGKEFSESTELMDAMQVATQQSILDIGDLQKAFAFAGSTAVMSGVEFEQLISIMAVLSNRALEAGIASRSVNKMFLDMITNTEELQEFMTNMGMTFEIIKDGRLDIDALMEAFSGQQLTLEMLQGASDVFTTRALRSFGLLIGAADEYQDMLLDVTNSQGALQAVVEVQMQSFTAMFAKLRQEFLAPLRTPEVMEQVGVMVDRLIELFKDLQPSLINAIVISLNQFIEVLGSESTIMVVEMLAGGLQKLFSVISYISDVFAGGSLTGQFLKLAIVFKIAQVAMIPFIMGTQAVQQSLLQNTVAMEKNAHSLLDRVNKLHLLNDKINQTANAEKRYELQQKFAQTMYKVRAQMMDHETLAYERRAMAVRATTNALMGAVGAGMMLGTVESNLMKAVILATQVQYAYNAAMVVSTALKGSSFAGPAAVAVFVASMALMLKVMSDMQNKMRSQQQELKNMAIMDSGGRIMDGRYADNGMTASRHQLVYVEPGETIIPKTQNMLGGGGINVNIGEVYAQDGTDFAEKLADALPYALRQVSDRGGI